MTGLNTRLLRQAAALAARAQAMQQKLTEAFEERYGTTYSAVDCDELIDVLDYAGGDIDLAFCDRAMTEAGYPPKCKDTSHDPD